MRQWYYAQLHCQPKLKRLFQAQRRRFFPLPDYDLSQSERVEVVDLSSIFICPFSMNTGFYWTS